MNQGPNESEKTMAKRGRTTMLLQIRRRHTHLACNRWFTHSLFSSLFTNLGKCRIYSSRFLENSQTKSGVRIRRSMLFESLCVRVKQANEPTNDRSIHSFIPWFAHDYCLSRTGKRMSLQQTTDLEGTGRFVLFWSHDSPPFPLLLDGESVLSLSIWRWFLHTHFRCWGRR